MLLVLPARVANHCYHWHCVAAAHSRGEGQLAVEGEDWGLRWGPGWSAGLWGPAALGVTGIGLGQGLGLGWLVEILQV